MCLNGKEGSFRDTSERKKPTVIANVYLKLDSF